MVGLKAQPDDRAEAFEEPSEHESISSGPPETIDDSRVIRGIQKYREALERGDRPDREEILGRYPALAGELAACLDTLDFVHQVAPQFLGESEDAEPGLPRSGLIAPLATLGDFRIVREIGRGGMGVVYEATQLSLNRRVALKVLPFVAVLDPRQLQRFKNEAQAAASLKHPNIVNIHAVGCERGVHYYAMEYVEGQTLAQAIDQLRRESQVRGRVSTVTEQDGDGSSTSAQPEVGDSQAAPAADRDRCGQTPLSGGSNGTREFFCNVTNLGIQAAEALEHAHQMGVVHRDIKPSNLIVDVQGHLWITDFGLAMTQTSPHLTMTGDIVGTLRYMSPEQAAGKGQVLDHHTDIYSLGLTLYELLALRPAFDGADRQRLVRQVLEDDPPALRQWNKAIPKDLETILLKATSKEPGSRYATAQQLADDLRRFLEDKPIHAKRPSLVTRLRKWARRHRLAVWAGGLLLLAVTAVAVFLAIKRERVIADVEQHLAVGVAFYQTGDYVAAEKELAEARTHFNAVLLEPAPLGARLQAQDRFQRFQDFRREVYANLYANTDETLATVLHNCRAALDLYGVFDAEKLQEQPAFMLMDQSQQAALREAIAELLFVWAETELSREQEPQEVAACLQKAIAALERIERFYHPVPGVYSWLAECHGGLGNEEAARQAQARAEQLKNTTALDHFILGESHYLCQNQLAGSMEAYRQALYLQQDHYLSLLAAGLTQAKVRRDDEAMAMLTAAIAINPNIAAYLARATLCAYHGGANSARTDCMRALEINPGNWFAYACTAEHAGDPKTQLERLAKASQLAQSFIPFVFVLRAYSYKNLGDYEAALADATRVIEFLKPRLPLSRGLKDLKGRGAGDFTAPMLYILACACRSKVYEKQGQPEKAAADLREIMQLKLGTVDDYRCRAEVLIERGKMDEAITDLGEGIRLDPAFPRTYRLRSEAYKRKGDLEKALADATQAIHVSPAQSEGFSRRGQIFWEKGEYDRAIEDCTTVISLAPKQPGAYGDRGNAHFWKGDLDRAIADYEKTIPLGPDKVDAISYANLGYAYGKKGDLDLALANFEKAIRCNPRFARGYLGCGLVYSEKGDSDRALALMEKAIQTDPRDARGYLGRGHVHIENGHLNLALADYERAIELSPVRGRGYSSSQRADAYCCRGYLHGRKGDFDRAIADFDKAIQLDPRDAGVYANRGKVYAKKGDRDRAIADFDKAIQLDPKDSATIAGLVEALATCPDLPLRFTDRAVSLAQRAVEFAPKYVSCWRALGVAQYRVANSREALRAFEKHAGLYSGESPQAWIFLTMTHWQLGHREEARRWYQKAVVWMDARKEKDMELLDLRADAETLFAKVENGEKE